MVGSSEWLIGALHFMNAPYKINDRTESQKSLKAKHQGVHSKLPETLTGLTFQPSIISLETSAIVPQ